MDIPTRAQLVERIDSFLHRHGMAPSRLGRDATGEPNLVTSIRDGRSPNLDTLNRLASFMAEHDAKLRDAVAEPGPSEQSVDLSGGSSIKVASRVSEGPSPRPFSATSSSTCPLPRAPSVTTLSPACSTGEAAMGGRALVQGLGMAVSNVTADAEASGGNAGEFTARSVTGDQIGTKP
jgi:hypothetical protein